MYRLTPFILFSLIALITTAIAWLCNHPQNAGTDVPAGKLKSVSFAPFREGFSPLKERFPVREHLEEDLALLAPRAESVRTYSSLGGLEPLPEIARKHNVTITQGAWLGWGEKENRKEIAALISSAKRNPDVVRRVIVGNEVLLRGEMDAAQLLHYIKEVKSSVPQPVSYADVWSMYLKHPEIIHAVDFITIHILPYWEDEPIAIAHAPDHLEKVFRAVETEARALGVDKPIFIGESGWPSLGRQRGFAVPSVINAARYTRGMIAVATHHGFDYNIVEAFNQPWKATLEGVVGANWGLFSVEREPVYPLTGSVTEDPTWLNHLLWALFLASAALILIGQRIAHLSLFTQGLWITLATVLSYGVVDAVVHTLRTSYSSLERSVGVLFLALVGTLAILLLTRARDIILKECSSKKTTRSLSLLYFFFTLFALYRTYHLARDGRYISFPLEVFFIPVIGLLGLFITQLTTIPRGYIHFSLSTLLGADPRAQDRWLGGALFVSILALFGGETRAFLVARDLRSVYPALSDALPVALHYTFGNTQLITWACCLLLLSLTYLKRAPD